MLLTIHFKRRLSTIEAKEDVLFEIINNMVNEISHIKHITNVITEDKAKQYNVKSIDLVTGCNFEVIDKYNDVMAGSDSDIDSDSDDDSDSDGDSDSGESRLKIVVSDDEDYTNFESSNFCASNIKIIDIDDEIDNEINTRVILIENEIDDEIKPRVILIDDEIDNESDDEVDEIKPRVILIDEVFVDQEILIDETINDDTLFGEVDKGNENDENDEIMAIDYSKESIQSLKTMVMSKGLSSTPSKLKKNELLKLLGSSVL
jgi:hypothetical protein